MLVRVLMVGNASSVKGGITSVISQLLQYDWRSEGVQMQFVPTYIDAGPIGKTAFYLKAFIQIWREVITNRPDVVYIHMSYKGSFYRKYAIHRLIRTYGIPDIVHLHGSEFKKWYDGADENTKAKVGTLFRDTCALIVLGNNWNRIVKSVEPQAKTVVLQNSVRIPEESVTWDGHRFTFLYLGVLIERKGVLDLIEAIHHLKEQDAVRNWQFVIAGTGALEEALKEKVCKYQLNSIVEFCGWIEGESKRKLLAGSQALILPSYNEGLPMAILEALSYGMPVVTTDVGDIPSAVQDGYNGYLFCPGDIQALERAIIKISDDPNRYNTMSNNAKIKAIESFSDKKYYKAICQIYRKLYFENKYED